MKYGIWIFVLLLTFALIPNVYAGETKEETDKVFFAFGYSPSIAPRYGFGHDISFTIYFGQKYDPGFLQFRYTEFKDHWMTLTPEDVSAYMNPQYILPGSAISIVSPRYELGFAFGPRLYQNKTKTKEAYLSIELFGGSLGGIHQHIYTERSFGDIVDIRAVQPKESGLYIVGALGPFVRIRVTENLSINGKVALGGGGAKYREISKNEWYGIWHARASLGAEVVF
jgi:hypothetical protein